MGNCGTKPSTNEGEAPSPEQKAEEITVESREIVVGVEEIKVIDQVAKLSISDSSTQPPSLGQLILEMEGKIKEEAIPTSSEIVKESIVETKEVVEVTTSMTKEVEPKKEAEAVVAEEEKKEEEKEKKRTM